MLNCVLLTLVGSGAIVSGLVRLSECNERSRTYPGRRKAAIRDPARVARRCFLRHESGVLGKIINYGNVEPN